MVAVVPVEEVEPAMSDATAELAKLGHELLDLSAEATRLERQVEDAGRRALARDSVVPFLERVLVEQTASEQAQLAAALEDAVREAERRLALARAEADAMVTDVRSGRVHMPPAPTVTVFPSFPMPVRDEYDVGKRPPAGLATRRVNGQAKEPAPLAEPGEAGPADPPDPATDVTIIMQEAWRTEPQSFANSTATNVAMPDPEPMPADPPAVTDDDPGAFGQFWDAETTSPVVRNAKAGILDAILPLVAVGIIVLVLLSWIG